jgi:inosine triphosphate pyrophosphatase
MIVSVRSFAIPNVSSCRSGWDPIFQPDGFDTTYAEMDKSIKNTISHRARAFDQFKKYLAENVDKLQE